MVMKILGSNGFSWKRTSFVFLIAIILSVFLVMAAEPKSTIKEYDPATKTVILKEQDGSTVASIQLQSEKHRVIFGKDDYAAEIKINNPLINNDLITNMEFFEDDKNGNLIAGSFTYKYYNPTGTTEINVNDYENQCETAVNGTETCFSALIGSHKESMSGSWEEFNPDVFLPAGETTIRMYWNGGLAPGQVIEWVPTFKSVRVEEWAAFEGASRFENFVTNNIQPGGTQFNSNQLACDIIDVNGGSFIVKGVSMFFSRAHESFNFRVDIRDTNSSGLPNNVITSNYSTNSSIIGDPANKWINFTLPDAAINNGAKIAICMNIGGGGSGINFDININITDTGAFGNMYSTDTTTNSTWDDVLNSPTTTPMLYELWGVSDAPTVNLTFPVDGFNSSLSSVTFNYSASDNSNVTNATLFIDGTERNTTFFGGGNNLNASVTISGLSNGNHNWSVKAYDNNNNEGMSATRIFSVDSIEEFENINVENNVSIGNELSALRGFFEFLGQLTNRIGNIFTQRIDTNNLTVNNYAFISGLMLLEVVNDTNETFVASTNNIKNLNASDVVGVDSVLYEAWGTVGPYNGDFKWVISARDCNNNILDSTAIDVKGSGPNNNEINFFISGYDNTPENCPSGLYRLNLEEIDGAATARVNFAKLIKIMA